MIEQHLPAMFAYARACARSDEAQDLVQEACKRLLAADYHEITQALAITTVKNIWRDRCASAALRYTQPLGDDTMLTAFVLPQVEEEIYARQIGKDLNDWPEELRTTEHKACKQCGGSFQPSKYRLTTTANRKEQLFCSSKCRIKHFKSNNKR